MTKELDIQPVLSLLAQSDSAYDVPAGPEMFVQGWLQRAREVVFTLAERVEAGEAAGLSKAENGRLDLFLHADPNGQAVYARVRDVASDPEPVESAEKSVALTLSGSVGFEAYRHADDVRDDQPWYVREFDGESIYACHPGTLHRLELSEDAVQLIVRDTTELPGRPVDVLEYRERIRAACQQLRQLTSAAGQPSVNASTGEPG